MKKTLYSAIIIYTASALTAAFASFSWQTIPDRYSGGSTSFLDQNDVELIGSHDDPAIGYFVQLLFDANMNGVDTDIVALGNGNGVGNGDMIVGQTFIGRGSADLTGPNDANGWIPQEFLETRTAGFPDDAQYYVRFWNAPATLYNAGDATQSLVPSTGDVWVGVSGLYTDDLVNGSGVPQQDGTFDITAGGSLKTDMQLSTIPEPSSFALIGLGAIALFARARKKK
jgi:hypothetical protein